MDNQYQVSNVEALTFSFYTMTTFGHYPPDGIINNDIGYLLTLLQSVIGLFMTLLILSRFIGLLPKVPTSDEVEREMKREM